jgi:hypothetical protein
MDKDVTVVQEEGTELDELRVKLDRIKEFVEELNTRFELIERDDIRKDLATAIIAGVSAYEKADGEVKVVAKGLILAAIGKLHMEVDKI